MTTKLHSTFACIPSVSVLSAVIWECSVGLTSKAHNSDNLSINGQGELHMIVRWSKKMCYGTLHTLYQRNEYAAFVDLYFRTGYFRIMIVSQRQTKDIASKDCFWLHIFISLPILKGYRPSIQTVCISNMLLKGLLHSRSEAAKRISVFSLFFCPRSTLILNAL